MQKLTLVSPPKARELRQVLRVLKGQRFHWAYLGQSILEFRQVQDLFEAQGTFYDTTSRFHQSTQDLRDPYLAYQFGIAQELNSLRWWFTPVAWRDSFVSKTFCQAGHLKTGLDLLRTWERQEPLILVADEPVCRSIQRNLCNDRDSALRVLGLRRLRPLRSIVDSVNMLGHRTVFVIREWYKVFQSRRMIPRPDESGERDTLLISWATPHSLSQNGEFHRFFFGDLAERLGNLNGRVAVAPMVLKEVRYKDALQRLRDSSLPVFLPHSFLGIFDPIKAALSTFRKPPRPSPLLRFSGMDVTPLLEEELRAYWISNQEAGLLLVTTLVKRWARWDVSIARIIYMYENKPWERALCWQARHSLPDTKLVGFSPTPVSRLLLNFFLAPGEADAAPLPDRVVTVGKHPARLLSADGYDPSRVRVGGALRMQDLEALRFPDRSQQAPGLPPTVLVAPSLGLEETSELAYMAAHLFGEDDGVEVLIKCHPMMPFEKVSDLISHPIPGHVRLSNEPIIELILKSAVMVYSSSTVCIEALALDVPVINARPQFDICLDPLEEFPDLRLQATGLGDLREKVRWLLDHREEYIAQHHEGWARMVEDMYSPVTEESIRAFVGESPGRYAGSQTP